MCLYLFFVLYGGNDFDTLNVKRQCDEKFCIPRVIWSHWNGDVLPDDVEEMVSVTRSTLRNFSYAFLTPRNVSGFVDLINPPRGFYRVHLAGQSDWIRICLLEKYGGFYVDSTTYITSGNAVEWVFLEALKKKRSVFGFQKLGVKCLIEMSMVGASEDSLFMKAYKEDYYAVLDGNNLTQYVLETCSEFKRNRWFRVDGECGRVYFLVHHVFLRTCYSNVSLGEELLILESSRGQFRLILECEMKVACFIDRLLYDSDARAYPFIKVTSVVRNGKKFHLKEVGYDPKVARREKDKNIHFKRTWEELDFLGREIQFRIKILQSSLTETKIEREELRRFRKLSSWIAGKK